MAKRADNWLGKVLDKSLPPPLASHSAASLLPRAKHIRHFLRDVVDVIDEPRPPKRLKLTDFQTASRPAIKPKLPEVKAFSGRIEMVPDLKKSGESEGGAAVKEKAVQIDTQRKEKPAEETAKKLEKSEAKAAVPPQKPAPSALPKTPPVSSFFVTGQTAPDAFIDDSGFLGGEDDSSEGEASGEETTAPPANPFFSSGSLFTKPGAPLFGKDEGGKQTGGAGLFAGTAGTNVFASFSSPSQPSPSLFNSSTALFPFSTPPPS